MRSDLWVHPRSTPSVPFLDQHDIRNFVAPPDEYIPQRQANLTIEDIAAAYAHAPPTDLPSASDQQTTSDRPLNDSEPRPVRYHHN